jgi:hypothetical protein
MSETVKPMATRLRAATFEYRYMTPDGEPVWAPFTLNNMPCLPNPDTDTLRRPGVGKISAARFQEAADYVYGIVKDEGLGEFASVPEAIRTRLVNGSLPNDELNYMGVDCSGFVTNVLQRSLTQVGGDLYQKLWVPYPQVVLGYDRPGWTPNRDEKEEILQRARESEGLSVKDFTQVFHGSYEPARAVGINLLLANADEVGDEVRPGDLAVYTPSNPSIMRHVTVVLDKVGERRVKFAHSGRRDPRIERGGIEIFTLPREDVFDRQKEHGHRGSMSIHRLRVLA